MNDGALRVTLLAIGLITVLSGLAQVVAPEFVLAQIEGATEPPVAHGFRTIGMFMVITGALFVQSLLFHSRDLAIPLWIGVQKLAAAALVVWGVMAGFFGMLALAVAVFDLFSGVVALVFFRRLAR